MTTLDDFFPKKQEEKQGSPYVFEVEEKGYKGYRCPRHGVIFWPDLKLTPMQADLLLTVCPKCTIAKKYGCPIPKYFKP
ncbi:MAG: hypothetical protein ACTSXW_08525 [Candidatus Baldrarchaeia archaeon]